MRQMPFGIDISAHNRWVELMTEALDEVGFPATVTDVLLRYFADTATFMINRAGA